jgi:hypothetical protein
MTFSTSEQHPMASTKPIATGVIVHDTLPEQKQSNLSWLSCVWNALIHHLFRGNEPRIRQKSNTAGEVTYHGYDPRTRNSIQCGTEADMRNWLDRLPYR